MSVESGPPFDTLTKAQKYVLPCKPSGGPSLAVPRCTFMLHLRNSITMQNVGFEAHAIFSIGLFCYRSPDLETIGIVDVFEKARIMPSPAEQLSHLQFAQLL